MIFQRKLNGYWLSAQLTFGSGTNSRYGRTGGNPCDWIEPPSGGAAWRSTWDRIETTAGQWFGAQSFRGPGRPANCCGAPAGDRSTTDRLGQAPAHQRPRAGLAEPSKRQCERWKRQLVQDNEEQRANGDNSAEVTETVQLNDSFHEK